MEMPPEITPFKPSTKVRRTTIPPIRLPNDNRGIPSATEYIPISISGSDVVSPSRTKLSTKVLMRRTFPSATSARTITSPALPSTKNEASIIPAMAKDGRFANILPSISKKPRLREVFFFYRLIFLTASFNFL